MNKMNLEKLKSKFAVCVLVMFLSLVGRMFWDASLLQEGMFYASTFGVKEKFTLRNHKKQQEEDQDFWITLPENFRTETHNLTVDGRTIPGPFWKDQLFLLGARLTTSYEDDDHSVHANLFGMGGDMWYREKDGKIRCEHNKLNSEHGSLWKFRRIVQETNVYVTLGGEAPESFSSMIPMERVPTISYDPNVDHVTLIWSADLSLNLTKTDLKQRMERYPNQAVRLQFWIQTRVKDSNQRQSSIIWPLTIVDIPILTGVVGHAGPQIRHSTSSSIAIGSGSGNETTSRRDEAQPRNNALLVHPAAQSQSALLQPPVDAALCVTVHSEQSLDRLPEFIIHHTNVGFDQIIVGVIDTLMDGEMIHKAQDKLQDFIADGTVNLAVAGLPSLECEGDIPKIHFYTSCLYHAKGVAEYVGIWDLDEYWVPPQVPHGKSLGWYQEKRPRSPLKTSDEIWRKSPYPAFPSIGQVMGAIHAYHAQVGCAELWCFHAMPSIFVYLRRDKTGAIPEDRAGVIHKDFELRTVSLNQIYRKSIARTKYVNMGGIHEPGSCRFSPRGKYMYRVDTYAEPRPYGTTLDYDDDEKCRNLRLYTEEYGVMHHFYSLNRLREGDACGDCVQDEYSYLFGKTVEKQLNARKMLPRG